MILRVRVLTRALLLGAFGGTGDGDRLPVAPLAFLGVLAALVAGLVRGEVGPFPYALVTLSVALALGTLPLLGELAPLLRADPAEDWIGAQPVRPREIRAARVLALALVTASLAVATSLPAALLATDLGPLARVGLVGAAVVQAWAVAAALLWVQALLGERGEPLLAALQAALLVAVLVGFLAGLRRLPELAQLEGPGGGLLSLPSAWFASLFGATEARGGAPLFAAGAGALALVTFALAPFPPAPRARPTRSALGVLLAPLRRLAETVWVRPEERGVFALVFDALPAERDFAIRAWPLVAMPLAFLFLGADPATEEGEGLWALLLFAPVAYLPFVLMHVPVTATPAARWLVDASPVSRAAEAEGARKAVALRILAPLHLGLGVLAAVMVDPTFALTLTPVSAAFGLLALQFLSRAPQKPPLSTRADELDSAFSEGLAGTVMVVGIVGSGIGLVAWRTIESPAVGFAALAVVVALELVGARRPRLGPGGAALILFASLALLTNLGCKPAPGAAYDVPWPADLESYDRGLVDALEERAAAVEADPTNARAWLDLGLTYEAHQKPALALRAYEGALRANDSDPRAWYRVAVMRMRDADADGALAAFERVHELAPEYAPAFRKRGRFLVDIGRAAEARAAFELALELSPSDVSSALGLAQVDLEEGDAANALARLAGLGSLANTAPGIVSFAHLLRGRALTRLGRDDEAARHLALGRGARAGGDDPWMREVARFKVGESARLLRADRLLANGDASGAVRLLEELRAESADDARVARRLGRAYADLGRWRDAASELHRASDLVPEDEGLLLAAATAADTAGDGASARLLVERYVAGLVAAAAPRATATDDSSERSAGFLLAATLALEAGDATRVVELAEEARSLASECAALEVTAGKAQLELGDTAGAGAAFARATELDERNADAWAGTALVAVRTGDVERARAAQERTRSLDPWHALLSAIDEALAGHDDAGDER